MTQDTEDVVAAALAATDDMPWSECSEDSRRVYRRYARAARQSLSDRIDVLREALKPFAAMAEYMDDTDERRDAIYCGGSPGLRCEVKRSDYHRARAALHQEGIAPK